jgi:type I restriction enzyme, R subunit
VHVRLSVIGPCSTRMRAGRQLSIFLNFLILKLPAPKEGSRARPPGTIDMDSHRLEKSAGTRIALVDENVEIVPVPASGGGCRPEPELDRLSGILQTFNEQFGDIDGRTRTACGG